MIFIILFMVTGWSAVYADVTCSQLWQAGSVILTARTTRGAPDSLYQVHREGDVVPLDQVPAGLFSNPGSPYFAPDGQDGLLYFHADTGSRYFIFALCADGKAFQLTSDPYGGGIDTSPLVSIQRKHLLFLTNRTGSVQQYRLAQNGIQQGPGYGSPFPLPTPVAWSPKHPDLIWYWKSKTTLAEYDISKSSDTGQTINFQVGNSAKLLNEEISISPTGELLALYKDESIGNTSTVSVVIYNLKGEQQIGFPVSSSLALPPSGGGLVEGRASAFVGLNISWSDKNTVVFAEDNKLYWANASTGQVNTVQIPGLQITGLHAVPKPTWVIATDFGAPYGIWLYSWSNQSWFKLHPLTATQLVGADLDGNGNTDLVVNFGNPYGTWVWMNNQTWVKLHALSPVSITAADLDGNGQADLVINFGDPHGTWLWMNNQSWVNLHNLPAKHIIALPQ